VVQWNEVRFFSGGTAGDTLTFQAVLYAADGTIRFNYLDLVSGSAAGNNGGSATVGIKASGTQGPNRVLMSFNVPGGNAFVGTGKSSSLTLPPAEDWYSFYVDVNKQIRVDTITPGDGVGEPQVLLDPDVEIYDPNGNLIARGVTLADGRNEIARINRTTLAGNYRARIRAEGGSTGVYFMGLYVADMGRGGNISNSSRSESISGAQVVPGLLSSSISRTTTPNADDTVIVDRKSGQSNAMTDVLMSNVSYKSEGLDQNALVHFFIEKSQTSHHEVDLVATISDRVFSKIERALN
jgi:hypothetical protein